MVQAVDEERNGEGGCLRYGCSSVVAGVLETLKGLSESKWRSIRIKFELCCMISSVLK